MYGSGWEETGTDTRASTARLVDASIANRSTDIAADLEGPKADNSFDTDVTETVGSDEESLGIIPRSVSDLFRVLEEKAAANNKFDYSVSKCILCSLLLPDPFFLSLCVILYQAAKLCKYTTRRYSI